MNEPKLRRIGYHPNLLSDYEKRKQEMTVLALRMWRCVWYTGTTYVVAAGMSTLFDGVGHWEAFVGLGIANLFWLASERD